MISFLPNRHYNLCPWTDFGWVSTSICRVATAQNHIQSMCNCGPTIKTHHVTFCSNIQINSSSSESAADVWMLSWLQTTPPFFYCLGSRFAATCLQLAFRDISSLGLSPCLMGVFSKDKWSRLCAFYQLRNIVCVYKWSSDHISWPIYAEKRDGANSTITLLCHFK